MLTELLVSRAVRPRPLDASQASMSVFTNSGRPRAAASQNQEEAAAKAVPALLENASSATFDATEAARKVTATTPERQQASLICAVDATIIGGSVTPPGVARMILRHHDAQGRSGQTDILRRHGTAMA